MRLSTTLVFLFAITLVGNAQEKKAFFSNIHYQTEAGAYLSTSGQNAFWLRSNQYGTVPLESQIATFRAGLWKDYTPKLKKNNDTSSNQTSNILHQTSKFTYGYGLQAVANVGKANQILIPEAYFKMRYGAFEIYAGRRREIFGLVDTTLSSGSYIWSGNALPMPKVQISIPEYTSIIGHGLISIKGNYAHGWFGNQGMVKNYYLHQKSLYGRIGKPNWRVKMYGGFNHQVQWGGKPLEPYIEPQTGKLITTFGNDFNSYLNVITGVSLNKNGNGLDLDGVPINDAWNRAGNHLGSADIGAEIELNKAKILMYKHSFYEDGSLYYLSGVSDGLYGLSIAFKSKQKKSLTINKICLEYFQTSNQGGNGGSGSIIPQLRGGDNYFNNSIYLDGWSYNKFIIGTSLLTPLSNIKESLIGKYGLLNTTSIVNNHVQAWHLAMSGQFKNLHFQSRIVNSKNIGFGNQFSFLQVAEYPYKKYTIVNKLGFDTGKLLNNGLSIYFGIRRSL